VDIADRLSVGAAAERTVPGSPEPELRAGLTHFLAVWPLALGKCAIRALEALAFGQLPPLAGAVLDLGCGDGAFGRWLVPHGDLWGVDQDRARLRDAADRGLRILAADLSRLPFAPRSFDVVVANSTLEHLADPRAAVREAHRVLRPGGRFLFTVPLAAALDSLFFGRDGRTSYRQQFNAYWQHRTMQSAAAWAALVAQCAAQFAPVRTVPIESPRQTQAIDLLSSVVVGEARVIRGQHDLAAAQRAGLAELLAELLLSRDGIAAGEAHSEALFEYVKL
jgi:SAM-dependent methyltransferase